MKNQQTRGSESGPGRVKGHPVDGSPYELAVAIGHLADECERAVSNLDNSEISTDRRVHSRAWWLAHARKLRKLKDDAIAHMASLQPTIDRGEA